MYVQPSVHNTIVYRQSYVSGGVGLMSNVAVVCDQRSAGEDAVRRR